MSVGTRSRAALASLGVLGLALAAAVSPAHAAGGTPATPTQPFNGHKNCSADAAHPTFLSAAGGLEVEAIPGTIGATDSPLATLKFQAWPVEDPAQVTTVTRTNAALRYETIGTFPTTALTDGETYAWQAQTVIGNSASDWSVTCYVTIDNTRPSAPTITSSNYPQETASQGGVPAEFTLDAGGDTDVSGFEYSWSQHLPDPVATEGPYGVPQVSDPYADTDHFVRANAPGGTAELTLVPPGSGPQTLWIKSLDRAFNRSDVTGYEIWTSWAGPTLTRDVASPEFGDVVTFTLEPDAGLQAISPIVSYTVDVTGTNEAKQEEVAAGADGTAKVTLTLDGPFSAGLNVTSKSANGWISDEVSWTTHYDSTTTITSDVYPTSDSGGGVGVPGTFTFTPKVKNVVSYTYSFTGEPAVTVPADGGGTATIEWSPSTEDFYDLVVYATVESGARTDGSIYTFMVE
ncbi:hypothetical protein [Streptomyces sp. NPDC008150]|uniref:hypothetical protein n=1 Tax=Streptomyces sp. NPDC008150 TaxID=3364816 RepID=UPI0036F0BD2D